MKSSSYIFYVETLSAILLVSFFSYITGYRETSIGTDTERYITYFERVSNGIVESRYEIGFIKFTEISNYFFGNHNLYLLSIYLFITILLFMSTCLLKKDVIGRYNVVGILLFYGIILSSNWYISAVSNAIRHGMALALLYVGIHVLVFKRMYLLSTAIIILSASFHQSIYLAFIFLPLLFFSYRVNWIIFAVLAIGYALGVWENVVAAVSSVAPVDLHSKIETFSEDSELWVGFQLDFFLYTIGWPLIYFAASICIPQEKRRGFFMIINIYMILAMPYFVFGFGAFSNRFAFISWLYIPILHYCFISLVKIPELWRVNISLVIFGFGFIKYYLFFTTPNL